MTEGAPLVLTPLPAAPELPPADVPAAKALGGQSSQRPDLPPVRPAEPDAADCCGEGCVRCVYDRYDAAVERYQRALSEWQARHPDPG
ncbi:MAG: oxidoreductase-like domain-containing protein [Rhodanobacter sp.]